ncbi:MAG: GNAT family N-acetyltransferase [Chloroflexales bacterium]|nr:GNAT family N-acetyltransferase [Chloroflexales bacterium]
MTNLRSGSPEEVESLMRHLPEFSTQTSASNIEKRLNEKPGQIMICESNLKPIGFLVAYLEDPSVFYNWIMGVLPGHRKSGFASVMMNQFEKTAVHYNCELVKVKTMNKYRSMLSLLIARGYNITAYEEAKITFERNVQR